jgi:hypothetical protein
MSTRMILTRLIRLFRIQNRFQNRFQNVFERFPVHNVCRNLREYFFGGENDCRTSQNKYGARFERDLRTILEIVLNRFQSCTIFHMVIVSVVGIFDPM